MDENMQSTAGPALEASSSDLNIQPSIKLSIQIDNITPSYQGGPVQYQEPGAQHGEKEQVVENNPASIPHDRVQTRLFNIDQPLSGTCQWIFKNEHFLHWRDFEKIEEHSGLLWIKGRPGCGKTTLMKVLVEHAKISWNSEITLAYFLDGRSDVAVGNSSMDVYRSLLQQLLPLASATSTLANKFVTNDVARVLDSSTADKLKDSLITVLATIRSTSVNVFIDALDESLGDNFKDIVHFADEVIARTTSMGIRLHICLSSRHCEYLDKRQGLSLIVEKQSEHSTDIEIYTKLALLSSTNDPETSILVKSICEKSDGVFLWAVLVVFILNARRDGASTAGDSIKLLTDLPTNLEDLLASILGKEDEYIAQRCALLQWVLFSVRPLTPLELYTAVRYTQASQSKEQVNVSDHSQLISWLLDCSQGLVQIAQHDSCEVQLIHDSVRTFLLGPNGLPRLDPSLKNNIEGLSHERMKRVCLKYIHRQPQRRLSVGTPLAGYMISKYERSAALLGYAVTNLLYHANTAQIKGVSQESFLLHLQRNKDDDFATWSQLHNMFQRDFFQFYSAEIPLLTVLIEQNLPDLVELLCEVAHVDVNEHVPEHEPALHIVCAEGNKAIARILIARGAMIDAQGPMNGFTALSQACAASSLDIVNLLLEYRADVNAVAGDHGSALQSACMQTDMQIVKVLLDAGADVNATGGEFGSPLKAASFFGCTDIMRLLIDSGADVNLTGGAYHTAVQAACSSGKGSVLRLLLSAGADVNMYAKNGNSALYEASSNGSDAMVSVLLEAGADTNACGGEHGAALQAASAGGYETIVRALLNAKAHVNAQGGEYGTAIQAAATRGYDTVVETLLRAQADPNLRGGKSGSPLHGAASAGHNFVVNMLIDAGADMNCLCPPYGSPLQAAAYQGYSSTVELLLAKGATLNGTDSQFGSVYNTARSQGHNNVVRILDKYNDKRYSGPQDWQHDPGDFTWTRTE